MTQRLLTGLLRLDLKLFLKPVLNPHIPFTWQRSWMRVVALITLNAPGARVRPELLGGVSGDHILPEGEPGLALLYLHGGAYVGGAPVTHRAITTALAVRARAEVFVPDYRLAPESPFPAALEDALAAYRALRERNPAVPIALAGDSAGGGWRSPPPCVCGSAGSHRR